jgi:hypothetical protein
MTLRILLILVVLIWLTGCKSYDGLGVEAHTELKHAFDFRISVCEQSP